MLLLWLATSSAEAPGLPAWVTRGDGAAAALTQAATVLATTAESVAASGRAERFPVLHAQTEALVHRARALEDAVAREP
jgi:hypothetical protein